MQKSHETHQAAMVAEATANVQARYVMALQRPRVWDDVRVKLLQECKRPGFAEVARYLKPIGKGVAGPSIRFAEAALRYAGNMGVDTIIVREDETVRSMKVIVTDFESNASVSLPVSLDKTVERAQAKDRQVIATRTNSAGNVVYILAATEDELLNKQNAQISKAVRTLVLRMIPGDIVEEGQNQCIETLNNRAAKDPAGERKRVCDAFASIGVSPSQLVAYLGHALEAIQPAELAELRSIFQTIKDGETTWQAVSETDEKPAKEEKKKSKAEALAEKVRAKATHVEAPPTYEPEPIDPETGEIIPEAFR